jgi:hypothetical protein
MIQAYSWSDLGYRKLGPLPASGNGVSAADVGKMLTQEGDNELSDDKGWVRRRARRKGYSMPKCIELVDVFDKDTPLDNERLEFVDRHAKSEWMKVADVKADFQMLTEVIAKSEKEERPWQVLYRLMQTLAYVGPGNMRASLRTQVMPCFFRMNPGGRIAVFQYDTSFEGLSAALRCLYAMAQTPLPDIMQGGFRGIQTLREWHMGSLTRLLPALLDFFGFLFYPYVGSVSATIPGLAFVFLMDPAEQHEIATFPRNWLAYPSSSGSFGKERSDLAAIMKDFHGPTHHRAAHGRFCHGRSFSAEERLCLLKWYVGRLNRFLYELTDVANFTQGGDPNEVIDPVFGYEHQLTVDRILRKVLLAMSLDEAGTGNLMVFEIADLFDTLSRRLGNTAQDTEYFKMLLNPAEAPPRIARCTGGAPAPFADYFAEVATLVYRKIQETVLESNGTYFTRNCFEVQAFGLCHAAW